MKVIIGCVIHSIAFGEIEIIDHGAIVYDLNGVIQQVIDLKKHPLSSETLASFEQVQDFTGKLIIPGFVDAHCHAPQYVFSGTGMDLPLLQWLEKYTFPCEAKFRDEAFARLAYEKSIKRHLKCGTTFASYFATIHLNACKVLVDVINEVGQRAHVGKVSMDRNSPDFYIEETEEGGEAAEEFVQYVLSQTEVGRKFLTKLTEGSNIDQTASLSRVGVKREREDGTVVEIERDQRQTIAKVKRVRTVTLEFEESLDVTYRATDIAKVSLDDDSVLDKKRNYNETVVTLHRERSGEVTLLNRQDTPLIIPCITPRFVPTCTKDIMQRLGEIAKKYGLPVQSHMSESVNEIAWVAELHPECDTYAGVYEQYGLLHEKAYMAHCCHSSKEEREILRKTGASAVHCASSNFMLSSGVMDVRQFLEEGIKVALGTDVAGGYSPSMLDALRQAVIASRVKGFEYKKMMKEQEQEVVSSSRLSPSESGDDASLSSVSSPSSPSSSSALVEKDYKSLNYVEAFHLATVGGAEVLGMGDVVGNFMVGKKLDCLIIDVHHEDSPIDIFEHESSSEHFQKFLFLGDDRNIAHVFVDGKCVI